jgi:hypothetical protein
MFRHYWADNFMCEVNTVECKPLKTLSANGAIKEICRTEYYVVEEDKLAEHRSLMWQYSDVRVPQSRGLDRTGV